MINKIFDKIFDNFLIIWFLVGASVYMYQLKYEQSIWFIVCACFIKLCDIHRDIKRGLK